MSEKLKPKKQSKERRKLEADRRAHEGEGNRGRKPESASLRVGGLVSWLKTFPWSFSREKYWEWFVDGFKTRGARGILAAFVVGVVVGQLPHIRSLVDMLGKAPHRVLVSRLEEEHVPRYIQPYLVYLAAPHEVSVVLEHHVVGSYPGFIWRLRVLEPGYALHGYAFAQVGDGSLTVLTALDEGPSTEISFQVPRRRKGDKLLALVALRPLPGQSDDLHQITRDNIADHVDSLGTEE